MRILIISEFFAPHAKIGAIRWTKIAKYLERDHDAVCDVIMCDADCGFDMILADDAKQLKGRIIIIQPNENAVKKYVPKAADKAPKAAEIKGILNHIKRSRAVTRLRDIRKKRRSEKGMWKGYEEGKQFSEKVVEYIKREGIRLDEYDCVAVSFGPVGCALAAKKLKELYPNMKLLMDFRDPMTSFLQPRRMNRMYLKIEDELCEMADVITTVSEGFAARIGHGVYDEKIHLILNGYDKEDVSEQDADTGTDEKLFSFCYTGSLYDGMRDISPLFEALSEMVGNGVADKRNIRFDYAGSNFHNVTAYAQRYGLGDVIRDHGVIPREEAIRLQNGSRFLTLCSWNRPDAKGVITGKFSEYVMAGRPIIALVSGSLPNSEIRCMIEKDGLGAVYEQGDRKATKKALYEYLCADYARFAKGLDCDMSMRDDKAIAGYDYRSIASSVAELICGVSEKRRTEIAEK